MFVAQSENRLTTAITAAIFGQQLKQLHTKSICI